MDFGKNLDVLRKYIYYEEKKRKGLRCKRRKSVHFSESERA